VDNVDKAVNSFLTEINTLEQAFEKDINKLVVKLKKMSDSELIDATTQLNFFQELVDRGYGDALGSFQDDYTTLLTSTIAEAKRRGIPSLAGASIEGLETLRTMDFERLLGRARNYSETLKYKLFRGIYAGESISNIKKGLMETKLLNRELNLIAHDGLRIFDDMSRSKLYEKENVRWVYVGPQDSVTRDACISTKENEPTEGYTAKEVSSTDTPFGIRGGFNCRHSWQIKGFD
tara:strand:+ start:175 stop:876 length:702 start_codon:yes stop_codon:yes gene_type:complete